MYSGFNQKALENRIQSTIQNYENLMQSAAKLNNNTQNSNSQINKPETNRDDVLKIIENFRNQKKLSQINQNHDSDTQRFIPKEAIFQAETSRKIEIVDNDNKNNKINNNNDKIIQNYVSFSDKHQKSFLPNNETSIIHNKKIENNEKSEFLSTRSKLISHSPDNVTKSNRIPEKKELFNIVKIWRKNDDQNQIRSEINLKKLGIQSPNNVIMNKNIDSHEKNQNNWNILSPDQQFNPMFFDFSRSLSKNEKKITSTHKEQINKENNLSIFANLPIEERLALREVGRTLKIEELTMNLNKKFYAELKEKPTISEHSKYIAKISNRNLQHPDLVNRLLDDHKKQKLRIQVETKKKEEKELKLLNFEPIINQNAKSLKRNLNDLMLWDKNRKLKEDKTRQLKKKQEHKIQESRLKRSFVSNGSQSLLKLIGRDQRKEPIEDRLIKEGIKNQYKRKKMLEKQYFQSKIPAKSHRSFNSHNISIISNSSKSKSKLFERKKSSHSVEGLESKSFNFSRNGTKLNTNFTDNNSFKTKNETKFIDDRGKIDRKSEKKQEIENIDTVNNFENEKENKEENEKFDFLNYLNKKTQKIRHLSLYDTNKQIQTSEIKEINENNDIKIEKKPVLWSDDRIIRLLNPKPYLITKEEKNNEKNIIDTDTNTFSFRQSSDNSKTHEKEIISNKNQDKIKEIENFTNDNINSLPFSIYQNKKKDKIYNDSLFESLKKRENKINVYKKEENSIEKKESDFSELSFFERNLNWMKIKNKKIENKLEEKTKKEIEKCTFTPNLNFPSNYNNNTNIKESMIFNCKINDSKIKGKQNNKENIEKSNDSYVEIHQRRSKSFSGLKKTESCSKFKKI